MSPKIEFTSLDKILFPEIGVTKGEVLQYYERVSGDLLPYLQDRPVSLQRMPQGIGGPLFWQKNTPDHYPSWIKRARLESETGKCIEYALVNDLETLMYLVNQGAITFHPYSSRIGSLDCPDFVVFDLDPAENNFKDVMKVALTLRKILAEWEVEATVKTSGKRGLHVQTDWDHRLGGHDKAREWAMHIAKELVLTLPECTTVERRIADRRGRIYVDVIQNAKGHHLVPPWVIRATPLATVATPLEWSELTARLDPREFNVRTVFDRLSGTHPVRRAA